jgi:hypothetical protein
MRVATEIILEISVEQAKGGSPWPHPWDHYPFVVTGNRVWVPYQDLTAGQRHQLTRALQEIGRTLGVTAASLCEDLAVGVQPSPVVGPHRRQARYAEPLTEEQLSKLRRPASAQSRDDVCAASTKSDTEVPLRS